MKTYLLLFGILFAISVNTCIAQDVKTIPIEKKYNGETYVVDSVPQSYLRSSGETQKRIRIWIINKNKAGIDDAYGSSCYGLKESIPLTDVFKKAISKEKIKPLAFDDKNRITANFTYDVKTGQVVWVAFLLTGNNITLSDDIDSKTDITLKDINNLEKLFKEYHFDVSNLYCESEKTKCNNNLNVSFVFSKLAEEEEKEK